VHAFIASASALSFSIQQLLHSCQTAPAQNCPSWLRTSVHKGKNTLSTATAAKKIPGNAPACMYGVGCATVDGRTLVTSLSIWFLLSCLIMEPKGRAVPADRRTHHVSWSVLALHVCNIIIAHTLLLCRAGTYVLQNWLARPVAAVSVQLPQITRP
jgi:hypothetical protein